METNEQRRTRRLKLLIDSPGIGIDVVAKQSGLSPAYLDQIVKGVRLPPKKDGTRSPRHLADKAARQIESGLGLTEGWLDWPIDAIDPSLYYSLSEKEKGALEFEMKKLIDSIIQSRKSHGYGT